MKQDRLNKLLFINMVSNPVLIFVTAILGNIKMGITSSLFSTVCLSLIFAINESYLWIKKD